MVDEFSNNLHFGCSWYVIRSNSDEFQSIESTKPPNEWLSVDTTDYIFSFDYNSKWK